MWGCLVGCTALFMPRVILVLAWLFTNYLSAYQTFLWPLLGFFFMPLTTLAYAWAWHQGEGAVSGFGVAVCVVAAMIDLGCFGAGEHGRRSLRSGPGNPTANS